MSPWSGDVVDMAPGYVGWNNESVGLSTLARILREGLGRGKAGLRFVGAKATPTGATVLAGFEDDTEYGYPWSGDKTTYSVAVSGYTHVAVFDSSRALFRRPASTLVSVKGEGNG